MFLHLCRSATCTRRARALLAFATVVTVGLSATIRPAIAETPIGDRRGIALFATMHRAHLHTLGVEMTVVSRGQPRRVFGHFLLKLRAGRVVAEEFAGTAGDPNKLVARTGGPTFAWQTAQKCWQRVPASDPRTLSDVGLPYPYPRASAKTAAPRRMGNDLIVETEDPDKIWFLATQNIYGRSSKRFVTYTVDAHTNRIQSIAIKAIKGGNRNTRPHPSQPAHWWTARVRVTLGRQARASFFPRTLACVCA